MANEQEHRPEEALSPREAPLAPGMPVIGLKQGERVPGRLVGCTDEFCLYRLSAEGDLIVAPWSDVAIGGLRPSRECLPNDPHEGKRRNHLAGLFWRLMRLAPFTLTATQERAREELEEGLGGEWGA